MELLVLQTRFSLTLGQTFNTVCINARMKSLDSIFLKKCDKVNLQESVVFVEYQEH